MVPNICLDGKAVDQKNVNNFLVEAIPIECNMAIAGTNGGNP
jgi:hypothetical protein